MPASLLIRSILTLTCVTALAGRTWSTGFSWADPTSGFWSGASEWTPAGGPPQAGDNAFFEHHATYVVRLATGAGNEADVMSVSDGVLTIESGLTTQPGVLNLVTGASDLNISQTADLHIGSASRPVTLNVGELRLLHQAELSINSGSDVDTQELELGLLADSRNTVRVSGAGTTLNVGTGNLTSNIGGNGGRAVFVVENGAAASFAANLQLAITSTDNTVGIVEVLSGATLNMPGLNIGTNGSVLTVGQIAKMTVSGAGSTVNQSGTDPIVVGHFSNDNVVAALTVGDSAIFNATGEVRVLNTGVLTHGNLGTNATFNANGSVVIDGGQLNVEGGVFDASNAASLIQNGGLLSVTGGKYVAGQMNITGVGAKVLLDGGELEMSAPNLPGPTALQWKSGVVSLTDGVSNRSLAIPSGATLNISSGGTTTINGALLVLPGATINVQGATVLGDPSTVNGFVSQGTLNANGHVVVLQDQNYAVLDSTALVKLDNGGGDPGMLDAGNGLTLDFGGNIVGFGTVDTPNDPFTPLINNGHISGTSAARPITLSGYVKGVGTLDNVVITGTDAPGFSPATVYRGGVRYAGTLATEIAGTSSGSFDRIIHSGTATLGGVLDVSLLGGFLPQGGDTFEILTATGGINGTFAETLLPALASGLDWELLYGASGVTLSVISTALIGDYNRDGAVNAADYVVWRNTFGSVTELDADGDGDNEIGDGDYEVWKSNYGARAGSSSTPVGGSAVPEPASLAVALVSLCGLAAMRRQPRLRFR